MANDETTPSAKCAPTGFSLSPDLNPRELARKYARLGRVQIPHLLIKHDADRLHAELRQRADWRLVINQADKLFELDRAAQAALDEQASAQLDKAVYKAARYDFQYRYESIRVPDGEHERAACNDPLVRFASFLSSEPLLALLREVTGHDAISFADAQATAYGPGHFLTAHNDEVAGKHRLAAYVFSLTPAWRIDWGGLLLFHSADGNIDHGLTPNFNALNLFAVPQAHSVSLVTPSAAFRRYSITGWLRAKSAT